MVPLTVFIQFLLLIVLCYADGSDIFARILHSRAKRHTLLDQSRICKTLGCLNGYCKESEMRKYRIVCECFPGYEGTLCDRFKCPFSCGNHGTCARKGMTVYCKCDPGFTGPRCNSETIPVHHVHTIIENPGNDIIRVNGQGVWYPHAVTPPDIKFTEFHSHAVIDTNVKPDICAPGFNCYHGVCDRKGMLYGRFRCLCKKNYTGLFCKKKCTLRCKNGGKCMLNRDGEHQFCNCPFNFQGYYCEKRIRTG